MGNVTERAVGVWKPLLSMVPSITDYVSSNVQSAQVNSELQQQDLFRHLKDPGSMHQLKTPELSVYHVPVGTELWVISDLLTSSIMTEIGEHYCGISTIQHYL